MSWTQKLLGMRIESDGDGARAGRSRLSRSTAKNRAMPQVHAIEVADGGNSRTKAVRNLADGTKNRERITARSGRIAARRNLVDDVHRLCAHSVTGTVSPSCANLTPAGSARLVSSWPRS